ncbi:MAG: glutamate--tRNA ligase [Candidatus Micrarchaeota archaeon]|nr:glutamate--tRNA ligase [Candidatus Micrarchaeota archaeon]
MGIEELARKYAVKNAVDYGKAMPGPIISKIMASSKGSDISEVSNAANAAVAWVNLLTKEELQAEYGKHSQEFASEKREKAEKTAKPKMELHGAVKGAFHTRYAPGPSGYATIGHAKAALLASTFANIYEGKLSLYFDDSNPEKEKQEYVDAIRSDLKWLGIKFDNECFASDNIPEIYDYARSLINSGKAYACSCDVEDMKSKRLGKQECGHRNTEPEESMRVFELMVKGAIGEGEAVIRFKGDMASENTALRDPTILRIKKGKHYRQDNKYSVWPLYDFNTPINDYLNGITDVIRSKEYELRDPLYRMILGALSLPSPRIHSIARLTIKNNLPSKRYQRIYIEEGLLSGYDDPRLVTLSALRRRGVRPEAIREFVLRFGMSKTDSVVDISMLMDENKKLVDQTAKRLFFVANPVALSIANAKSKSVELKLHPTEKMGSRKYAVDGNFYISGDDAGKISPTMLFRLKDLYSLRMKEYDANVMMAAQADQDTKFRIQWVASKQSIPCEVIVPKPPLLPDGQFDRQSLQVVKGYAEAYASKLKEREVVQFERFGFCILDDKKKMSFIFMSK